MSSPGWARSVTKPFPTAWTAFNSKRSIHSRPHESAYRFIYALDSMSSTIAATSNAVLLPTQTSRKRTRAMSISLSAGSRLPAYCTSLRRVLVTHLPVNALDDYSHVPNCSPGPGTRSPTRFARGKYSDKTARNVGAQAARARTSACASSSFKCCATAHGSLPHCCLDGISGSMPRRQRRGRRRHRDTRRNAGGNPSR
jgi:hypothetical protein